VSLNQIQPSKAIDLKKITFDKKIKKNLGLFLKFSVEFFFVEILTFDGWNSLVGTKN